MNRRLIALLLLLMTLPACAKAYYATRREMVERAEVIAIVDVEEIQPTSLQGKHWTYSESAEARVVKCVKGQLPERITLLGKESFICAQVNLHRGRCLVFLKKDTPGYAGCNWRASCIPIDKAGQLSWLPTPGSREVSTRVSLDRAERDIQADMHP